MDIGENCRRLRKKQGMSQAQLADKVGVRAAMISYIEAGTKTPSVGLCIDISNILGVTINDLCGVSVSADSEFSITETPSKISVNFGDTLKRLRTSKQLTQRELAENLYCSESTISLYESGKREPDLKTLIKLASFFEVSVDYLLGVEHGDGELKLCPFCGGETKIRTGVDKPSNIPMIQLRCQKCGIRTPWHLDTAFDGTFIDGVKKAWNRRMNHESET